MTQQTSKISFLHLRNLDRNGQISCRGGSTVAYRQTVDGTIEFATAFCNSNDNFNKAYGRAKAAGRLNSDRYCSVAVARDLAQFRQDLLDSAYGE